MADIDQIDVRDDRAVRTITFYHPKGNSLPGSSLRGLSEAVMEAGQDSRVKVIVLQSRGDQIFCAGASFDELTSVDSPSKGKDFYMGFTRLILSMRNCPKFIIARVQGKVVGGGVGVVAAADYALAHQTASLRLSELALGIGPFVVGPVIERKIGSGKFQAMALDTEWRDAKWGRSSGLYAKVYDTHVELDEAVHVVARGCAERSVLAVAKLKAAFWQGTEHWETLLEARASMSGSLALSNEARTLIKKAAGK